MGIFDFLHRKCERQIEELANQAAGLEQKIKPLEGELKTAQHSIVSLSKERTDLAGRLKALESEAKGLRYNNQTLEMEKQDNEKDNRALSISLAKASEEFGRYKQDIGKNIEELDKKYQTEICDLEKDYQDRLDKAGDELNRTKDELNKTKENYSQLVKKVEELKAVCQKSEQLRQDLKTGFEKKEAALFVQTRRQLEDTYSKLLKLYLDDYRTLRHVFPDKMYVNQQMFDITVSLPFDEKEKFLRELKAAITTSSDEVDETFRKYWQLCHNEHE